MNYKTVILMTMVLAVTGCFETVSIDTPYRDDILNVQSLANPDSSFVIIIDKPWSSVGYNYYGKQLISYENVEILIFEEGNYFAKANYDSLKLFSLDADLRVSPGKEYQMEVKAPNYQSVQAKTKIPPQTPLFKIDSVIYKGTEITWTIYHRFSIELTLINHPDDNNYVIQSGGYQYEYDWVDGEAIIVDSIFRQDVITSVGNNIEIEDYTVYGGVKIKDSFGDQNQVKISLNVKRYDGEEILKSQYFLIRVLDVNSDILHFISSLDLQNSQNFLSEPVQVYSNIQNGVGLFGGYTLSAMDTFVSF